MEFSVDAAALAGLPKLLDRWAEDAQASRVHLTTHADLRGTEGIFNTALGGHRSAVAEVDAFLTSVGAAANAYSTRVQTALRQYRRSDLAASASFDATLPGASGPVPSWRPDLVGGAAFTDRARPQDALTPPPDHSAEYGFEFHADMLLSPSSWARELIWEVTNLATRLGLLDRPIDIFAEWLKPWLGDWAGLRACADLHLQLGEAASAMATNVHGGMGDLTTVWSGNAADGCRDGLWRNQLVLIEAQKRLAELAEEYVEVAQQVHILAENIALWIEVVVDSAVMLMIELELAVATSETIIGGIVFSAAAIYEIWEILDVVAKVIDRLHIVSKAAALFASAADGFSIADPTTTLPRAYAVPGSAGHKYE